MQVTDSYIHLNRLRFHAFHGVEAQERLVGNTYEISLRLQCDVTTAMQTDDVCHTVNYASVYAVVKEEMAVPSQLVEHVAGRIGARIFQDFPAVKALQLQLTKLNPPMGADSMEGAGVELHLINNTTIRNN